MSPFIPFAITNPNPIEQTHISKGQEGHGHCGPKAKKDFVVHSLKSIFLKSPWSCIIMMSEAVLGKHFEYCVDLRLSVKCLT